MTSYVQILNPSTGDGPPAIVVHAAYRRYLFNCPEGLQRSLAERGFKLTGKIEDVFLTRLDAEACLGLPGLILTLADCGTTELKVHGPANTTHFLTSTRAFVRRTENIYVSTAEYPQEQTLHVDPCLTVVPVMLHPENDDLGNSRKRKLSQAQAEMLACKRRILPRMFRSKPLAVPEKSKKMRKLQSRISVEERIAFAGRSLSHGLASPTDEYLVADTHVEKHADVDPMMTAAAPSGCSTNSMDAPMAAKRRPAVLCYVCTRPTIPGKFNVEAAKALGVKPGKLFGLLTQGQSVKNGKGETVYPHQVLGSPRHGPAFIILDVPSVDYIPSLLSAPEFKQYQKISGLGELGPRVNLIVHMLGDSVLDNPAYRKWTRDFPDDVTHIFSSRSLCPDSVTFVNTAFSQFKHSVMDDKIFPVPYYKNEPEIRLDSYSDLFLNSFIASPMLKYILEPEPFRLDSKEVEPAFDHLNPDSPFVSRLQSMTEYMAAVQKMKEEEKEADGMDERPPIAGGDVVVTTLGTGASMPSKYRNVSATVVKVPGKGTFLLDAGEGTYGQMWRHFGPEGTAQCLRDLRLIFVSHMHADHHIGVVRILVERNKICIADKARYGADQEHNAPVSRLVVLCPRRFWKWVREASEVEDVGLPYLDYVNCEDLLVASQPVREVNEENGPASGAVDEEDGRASGAVDEEDGRASGAVDEEDGRASGAVDEEDGRASVAVDEEDGCASGAVDEEDGRAFGTVDLEVSRTSGASSPLSAGSASSAPERDPVRIASLLQPHLNALGLSRVTIVDAIHCPEAYGIVLTSTDCAGEKWTIVYSGDSRPCARLVEAGKDCTLLIHEATFEDDMMEQALYRKHSTTGEAILIGKRMNAKHILLTHFSQRYPKIPVFSEQMSTVGVAFDCMSVAIRDLHRLPRFIRPLKILYADDCDERVREEKLAEDEKKQSVCI